VHINQSTSVEMRQRTATAGGVHDAVGEVLQVDRGDYSGSDRRCCKEPRTVLPEASPMLQGAEGSATGGGRQCWKGANCGAIGSGRRCFEEPAAVLPAAAAGVSKSRR
jgi:hypothetical protein